MDHQKVAAERDAVMDRRGRSYVLTPDCDKIGSAGECEVREFFGAPPPPPFSDRKRDPGYDLILNLRLDSGAVLPFKAEVKTARKPGHLVVKERTGKVADLFILCGFDAPSNLAYIVGWQWGRVVRSYKPRVFGAGALDHVVPAKTLRFMSELKDRFVSYAEPYAD